MKFILPFVFLFYHSMTAFAQSDYWQMAADYTMKIDFNAKKHQFTGTQKIVLTNNSPDTLYKLFYHLYFNAFKPESEMDLRSRSIADPDRRVSDRISKLDKKEIGFQKVNSLKLNGKPLSFKEEGTILEVDLTMPILPGSTVDLEMDFEAQVPLQIRRSGRDSKEGIAYSMAQWYPKLCNYDRMGWHPDPYVAREFYGIWGKFDVSITIDKDYVLGGTGTLVNADRIGHGYSTFVADKKSDDLTWHFVADRVHDFMWAADKDYVHLTHKAYDGTLLHFFYQENDKTRDVWTKLPSILDKALEFMNARYGQYPYKSYSFIQGGDGGMEYPMGTLITGERPLISLVGVSVHEWMHSWYQSTLGTNESMYPWMDEGFTSFATSEVMDYLIEQGAIAGKHDENPLQETIAGYIAFAKSGNAEPLSTHSDHYVTNTAYGVGSYTKGQLCLVQLEYIMGKEVFARALKKYYNTWMFKHPHPQDFFNIMEKESGLVLDWFQNYWINTTHMADYKIDTIKGDKLTLKRVGEMPMPIELQVVYKDGKTEDYYIPLVLMRGVKKEKGKFENSIILPDWPWAQQEYEIQLNGKHKNVAKIVIDPLNRMVDVNPEDNEWTNQK